MLSFILFLVVYRTIPTSNHNLLCRLLHLLVLYIVLFLHQTTTLSGCRLLLCCCISYYSYIKPQLADGKLSLKEVVYRTIPTSNHNLLMVRWLWKKVVYRTIPTSNHNFQSLWKYFEQLYIVLFLHQTTTGYIIAILQHRCISYYSYIKPQLRMLMEPSTWVVYRTIPTSNHN